MSHRAYVAHRLPGRLRLTIPDAVRNERALESIKTAVVGLAGVRRVDVSPLAGSVLIYYDRGRTDGFEDDVRRQGLESSAFRLETPEVGDIDAAVRTGEQAAEWLAGHSAVAREIVAGIADLNDDVKIATGGALDLKVLVPLSLAAYAFLHRKSSISTPLWVTLGLFSFNAFVALHPVPPTAEAGGPVGPLTAAESVRHIPSTPPRRSAVRARPR